MVANAYKPGRTKNTGLFGFGIAAFLAIAAGFTLFTLRESSMSVAWITVAMLCAILILIVYLTLSGIRMAYELDESALFIRLGMGGQHVPYANIVSAHKADLSLTARIFGGSWPGFHFGLYRVSRLGNVTVYATRASGEYALLTLANGKRIAISPEDNAGFLSELNSRRAMYGSAGSVSTAGTEALAGLGADKETEAMPRKLVYLQIAAVAIPFAHLLACFASVYPVLPQTIPLHFDANWVPNRWGDKSELIYVIGIAAIFPILNTVFCLKFWKYGRLLSLFMTAIFLLAVLLFIAILHATLSAL